MPRLYGGRHTGCGPSLPGREAVAAIRSAASGEIVFNPQSAGRILVRQSGVGMEKSSSEIFVSKSSELKEGERKIVPNSRTGIGVYRFGGKLVAYENLCPHQGGPACEGIVMPKVEEVILPDRTCQGM